MTEDRDDLEARMRRLDARGRRALLEDLEAIRGLLDDEGASGPNSARAPTDSIPVLREVVAGSPQPGGTETAPSGAAEDQGDLFDPRAFADRLLDDQWALERERILDDARRGADVLRLGMDEAEITRREAAFRAAVHCYLAPRMEQVVGEAMDALQHRLLTLLQRELEAMVQDSFASTHTGRPEAAPLRRDRERDD